MPSFAEKPETTICNEIQSLALQSFNKWKSKPAGLPYFDRPLVGFADAADQLFTEFKNIIGPFHLSPLEVLAQSFPEHDGSWLGSSVISWVIPIAKHIRESNRENTRYPSKLWAESRKYAEAFNSQLKNHIVSMLEEQGFLAVAPTLSSLFAMLQDDRVGFTSNWSERHIAYVAGLGTFGLSGALISKKGVAIRFGSVVTNLHLTPTQRTYHHYQQYCLFYSADACGKCITRCPSGAITEKGQNEEPCLLHCAEIMQNREEPDSEMMGCGLCLTAVPCESGIPNQSK